MTEALIGLGGVVLGVVLTTAVQHLSVKRSERNELREASRVLEAAMFLADMALVIQIEIEEQRVAKDTTVLSERCEQYQGLLARRLPRREWDVLQHAFDAVYLAQEGLAKNGGDEDTLRQRGQAGRDALQAGLAVLAKYSGGSPLARFTPPDRLDEFYGARP